MRKKINLRYLNLDKRSLYLRSVLIPPHRLDNIKARALERLKINRREGQKFFDAWLLAMENENGLEDSPQSRKAIGDAIMANPSCLRFIFFLS